MDHAQREQVSEAFSRQGRVFDELDEAPLIQWTRGRVREAVMRWLQPGNHLLEINCGTGIDSFWFAEQGLRVTATDDAPGMLVELERKLALSKEPRIEHRRCSFLELDRLDPLRADAVLSNFGGINCTDRLSDVLRGIDARLVPGGICALVIMPRFSPWELVETLRGNVAFAFRRYGKNGALAQVEGVPFRCWYHDAKDVRRALPAYTILDRMALSFFMPPPHLGPFAARHPRLTRTAARLERALCRWPFIRSRGDHYLVILRKPR
jgi:ubiquinone/menaquinone biosynthesis C-methylase UbiE